MPDYTNGKIYTIRCKTDDNLIYVGSTIQSLPVRFGGHKKDSKRERNQSILLYSKIEDWNDWYIELYETYPCNNVQELKKREGEIIRQIGTLNREVAGRTKKEYRQENKEKCRERDRLYEIKNADKIRERKQEYYENNKERIKQYYEENKEKIKERKKSYYEKNKDKIKERKKDKLVIQEII